MYRCTSLNRRTHQKKANKIFQWLNKSIEDDVVWHGRFVAQQIDSQWEMFPNNLGGRLHIYYELIDKKTKQAKLCHIIEDTSWIEVLRQSMKTFIMEDTMAWKDEMVLTDITDWTKINIPPWSRKRWRQEERSCQNPHNLVSKKELDN